MIDAEVHLVDPSTIPEEERIPGESLPVRAVLRLGAERLGVLVGHLPATRLWDRADQDLLELYASEIAVAIRNAELFAQVESQNAQLLELDAAKDDFLRGVSHNLQTPLTSIRATADQLGRARPDRRLGIIVEQTDRLSRMVRQLLTVTRLESGALRPRGEVVALAHPIRRAWEALAVEDVPFEVRDRSAGWLAVADVDQLDQVLWALLDNAVKYGGRIPIDVDIEPEREPAAPHAGGNRLRVTIADHGPGVADADRGRLFGRFERGAERNGRRRQRPRAVRLARAVPGDGRRPRARAAGAGSRGGLQHLPAGRATRRGLSQLPEPDMERAGTLAGGGSWSESWARPRPRRVASDRRLDRATVRRARGLRRLGAGAVPDDPARIAGDDRRGGRSEDRPEGGRQPEHLGDHRSGIPEGVEPEDGSEGALLHARRMRPAAFAEAIAYSYGRPGDRPE